MDELPNEKEQRGRMSRTRVILFLLLVFAPAAISTSMLFEWLSPSGHRRNIVLLLLTLIAVFQHYQAIVNDRIVERNWRYTYRSESPVWFGFGLAFSIVFMISLYLSLFGVFP